MTPQERTQFDDLADQVPELKTQQRSIVGTVLLLLAVISLGGGAILGIAFSSWRMFVVGLIACVALVLMTAVIERKPA